MPGLDRHEFAMASGDNVALVIDRPQHPDRLKGQRPGDVSGYLMRFAISLR